MQEPERKNTDRQSEGIHERLLRLAGVYRNLNRRELARALGRDSGRGSSPGHNPKLDYVVRLAQLLDWPVGEIAEALTGQPPRDRCNTAPCSEPEVGEFDRLDKAAKEAHQRGDYAEMCQIARQLAGAADTPDRRALAALREAGGWDGLGRYAHQLEAIRRGLQHAPESLDLRLLLQANLANAYYTLSYLLEARGMARELIDMLSVNQPMTRSALAARAFGYYVLGNASRRLMAQEPAHVAEHARAARQALRTSSERYEVLAAEFNHAPWRGIANTCRGGVIETEVELDLLTVPEAMDMISEGLASAALDDDQLLRGDQLESWGWWCVFGCNIALRHLQDAALQQQMESLTQRGFAIAARLNNWAMREQLLTLQLLKRERLSDSTDVDTEWVMNDDELRTILGTMGRFPTFRRTGWRILEMATLMGKNEGTT